MIILKKYFNLNIKLKAYYWWSIIIPPYPVNSRVMLWYSVTSNCALIGAMKWKEKKIFLFLTDAEKCGGRNCKFSTHVIVLYCVWRGTKPAGRQKRTEQECGLCGPSLTNPTPLLPHNKRNPLFFPPPNFPILP